MGVIIIISEARTFVVLFMLSYFFTYGLTNANLTSTIADQGNLHQKDNQPVCGPLLNSNEIMNTVDLREKDQGERKCVTTNSHKQLHVFNKQAEVQYG